MMIIIDHYKYQTINMNNHYKAYQLDRPFFICKVQVENGGAGGT